MNNIFFKTHAAHRYYMRECSAKGKLLGWWRIKTLKQHDQKTV